MVLGYIFIKTGLKKEVEAYRELMMIPEVVELNPLFGEYDLVAKVEAHDFNVLSRVVLKKIRKIPGVLDTLTMPGTKI